MGHLGSMQKPDMWDAQFAPRGPEEARCEALSLVGFRIPPVDRRRKPDAGLPGSDPANEVFRRVEEIARAYNFNQYRDRMAPRVGEAVRQLNEIAALAGKLDRKLTALSPYATQRIWASCEAVAQKADLSVEEVERHLFGRKVAPERRPEDLELLGAPLRVLAQVCCDAAEKCALVDGSGDVARPDVGGRTNSFRKRSGHPKWSLVRDCWVCFEAHRPDEATVYAQGPFAEFVYRVFEYATGKPALGEGLEGWVKRGVGHIRHLSPARQIAACYSESLCRLDTLMEAEEDPKALDTLQAEYDEIEQEFRPLANAFLRRWISGPRSK